MNPPPRPISIRDLDNLASHAADYSRMEDPMADPCPDCGAFNMLVGDYVCFGMCYPCYQEREKKL